MSYYNGTRTDLSLNKDTPKSRAIPALLLSLAAATAIFHFKVGMIIVLAASCAAGIFLRLASIV
jgi:chromate transporter